MRVFTVMRTSSSNDGLELDIEAGGTCFDATAGTSKATFECLMDTSQWMIYQNVVIGLLHWDFVRLPIHPTSLS